MCNDVLIVVGLILSVMICRTIDTIRQRAMRDKEMRFVEKLERMARK
jgi:hypothetical protein